MEELYQMIMQKLEEQLFTGADKPEETIYSTLSSLWNKAYGHSISAERASKIPLPKLSDQQENVLNGLIEQRLNNTPLAYLTGRQNFMGIEFLCDNRALIPRKETEILGRAALELCQKIAWKRSKVNVLDICCGSGNVGLALASLHPQTIVHSSDLSQEAVELTMENISFLNLEEHVKVAQSDLFSNFESEEYYGKIDLIVCNPPYISTSKVSKMTSEISANEPAMAFDGGMLGLNIFQKLIKESPKFLSKGGWLIFEVGVGQGPFVLQICEKSGLYEFATSKTDDSGNLRVIEACY
jgi:release factor glutamine methyltransferase